MDLSPIAHLLNVGWDEPRATSLRPLLPQLHAGYPGLVHAVTHLLRSGWASGDSGAMTPLPNLSFISKTETGDLLQVHNTYRPRKRAGNATDHVGSHSPLRRQDTSGSSGNFLISNTKLRASEIQTIQFPEGSRKTNMISFYPARDKYDITVFSNAADQRCRVVRFPSSQQQSPQPGVFS